MHRRFGLFYLAAPLVFFAISALSQETSEDDVDDSLDGYDHRILARGALAQQIADLRAGCGDDGVDTSLEGYNHNVVARSLLDKRGAYGRAPLHIRNEIAEQAPDLIYEHGQNIDLSLEGYDHDLVARSLEGLQEGETGSMHGVASYGEVVGQVSQPQVIHVRYASDVQAEMEAASGTSMAGSGVDAQEAQIERRAVLAQEEEAAREDLGDEVDYSLEGFDHTLFERDPEDEDEPEDIDYSLDYSLEGYDHHLVARSMKGRFLRKRDQSTADAAAVERRKMEGPPMQSKRGNLEVAARVVRRQVSAAWSNVRRWMIEDPQ